MQTKIEIAKTFGSLKNLSTFAVYFILSGVRNLAKLAGIFYAYTINIGFLPCERLMPSLPDKVKYNGSESRFFLSLI